MRIIATLNSKSRHNSRHNAEDAFPKTDVRYWQKRIFKHRRQARGREYVDPHWSIRIGHDNRQERIGLGTANQYEATRKARRIYQYLIANGWEQTLANFKPSKVPAKAKVNLSIGEFLSALQDRHPSKSRTIAAYAGSLRKIAAYLAGIKSGGRGGKADNHRIWRQKVEAIKLTVLTPVSKIQKWKEAFLSRAGHDPVKQRSARVSVNTFIREARTLFGPKMLDGLEDTVLPNPLPFAGIKLEKRSMPRYQSTFDVMALVKAAREELAIEEPEQFKIFVLAVVAGLRRGEIDKLEWSAFNWSAGTINIAPTKYFRTKTEDSIRSVWVPSEMLEIFRGYRAKAISPFVLESTVEPIMGKAYEHYRCITLFEKLIAWLREKGVTANMPLHTLRKEFGSLIAAQFGIYAAKQLLGHADIATTASHYLEARDKPMVGFGGLLTTPENVIKMDEHPPVSGAGGA